MINAHLADEKGDDGIIPIAASPLSSAPHGTADSFKTGVKFEKSNRGLEFDDLALFVTGCFTVS
jgi:hypothetical protein